MFKNWNKCWEEIKHYNHLELKRNIHTPVITFTNEIIILGVKYQYEKQEYEDNDKDCYYVNEQVFILITYQKEEYELIYWQYFDHYDIYEPDLLIRKKGTKRKMNLYDFLNNRFEGWTLFWEMFQELLEEIKYEYSSEERMWEIEQEKSNAKKFQTKKPYKF